MSNSDAIVRILELVDVVLMVKMKGTNVKHDEVRLGQARHGMTCRVRNWTQRMAKDKRNEVC